MVALIESPVKTEQYQISQSSSGMVQISRTDAEYRYLMVATHKSEGMGLTPILLDSNRFCSGVAQRTLGNHALQFVAKKSNPRAADWFISEAVLLPSGAEISAKWDFGWEFTLRLDGRFMGLVIQSGNSWAYTQSRQRQATKLDSLGDCVRALAQGAVKKAA